MKENNTPDIRVIVGLGNPGHSFYKTRHSIGFRIIDTLAERLQGTWKRQGSMAVAKVVLNDTDVWLVKPQTYMNRSGEVIPALQQLGFKSENMLVVHDDIELPFGTIKIRFGGSPRGHKGLKSIIEHSGKDFYRLRFGIGRPEHKNMVPEYVLEHFSEDEEKMQNSIEKAISAIIPIKNSCCK